jgi:hypothetical protein
MERWDDAEAILASLDAKQEPWRSCWLAKARLGAGRAEDALADIDAALVVDLSKRSSRPDSNVDIGAHRGRKEPDKEVLTREMCKHRDAFPCYPLRHKREFQP